MSPIEVLRSSVNTWECDQMGHLNVRHYFARANQGLALLALQLGLPPSALREQGLALRALDQHVRFMRELRPGAAYTVRAGVLAASADRLQVYEELAFAAKPELAASVISDVVLVELATGRPVPLPDVVRARAPELAVEVPAESAPRGISRAPARVPPTRDEAVARGMTGAYLGPVLPEDCDASGSMLESAFMARISDGIGHLFARLYGTRKTGGAALEYRYAFHARPRLGDIIEVRSALKGLGNKTTHLCHYVFDVESGRCVASSEAVAVSFDLTTRKSVEIPPELRAHLEQHVVPGIGF